MKYLKKILLALAVVLVVIQFVPQQKNVAAGVSADNIAAVYSTPEEVKTILATSCNDCHSNNTTYPWYSNIQPVGFWLANHVNEGKEKLNFDEFAGYSPRRQYHKLEETDEMLVEGEMPLASYTFIHKDAVLNQDQKELLINWTKRIRREMEATYPIDSLITPKKNL